MPNNKGRPYKFVEQIRERYLGLLRAGYRLGDAAKACGMARSSIIDYAKQHPEFRTQMDDAEAAYCDVI